MIHTMTKDDDFYMFYFKTEWCPFNKEHNKASCDYAHNWQDFRRKPQLFAYDCSTLCQNWKAGTFIATYEEGCVMQAACPHSHGWKEQEYHPINYKTKSCEEPDCQKSNVHCPFYHTESEKRYVKNKENAMIPVIRKKSEQLYPITLNTMTINNVNHLKEYLLSVGSLPLIDF